MENKDAKQRCLDEWSNVNDPPCHPGDADWRPCALCALPDAQDPIKALEAHRARGNKSLKDSGLEEALFSQLAELERTNDGVAPTPLRHKLSELIVQMRAEIWAFDQSKSPWK